MTCRPKGPAGWDAACEGAIEGVGVPTRDWGKATSWWGLDRRHTRHMGSPRSIGIIVATTAGLLAASTAVGAGLTGVAFLILGDGGPDSMIGIVYLGVFMIATPIAYVGLAAWAIARAQEPTPVAVGAIAPFVVIGGAAAFTGVVDRAASDRAEAVASSFEIELPGLSGRASSGGVPSSSYVCRSTSTSWTITNGNTHDEAFAWLSAAQAAVEARGWDAATGHHVDRHVQPRPDDVSAAVVGRGDSSAVVFTVAFLAFGDPASGYRPEARASMTAFSGDCLDAVAASALLPDMYTPGPLPGSTPDVFEQAP